MTRLRGREDLGASLTIVMVVVIGFGLVTGALLTYTASALSSARATAAGNQAASDVGTALQAAINDVRNGGYVNNPSSAVACFPSGATKTYAPSGQAVVVSCDPDPASGAAGGQVPVNTSNKPALALLTLGTGGEPGLRKSGNSVLTIKGSVYSNSTIATSGGTDCPANPQPPATGANCNEIYVLGASVTAEGACTGRIVASGSPGVQCATGAHSAIGDDPGTASPATYAQPTTGMTPVALPSCSGNPVTFEPGYYDDAVALSALFGSTGPCAGKTRWFRPGTYYFDFRNEEMPSAGSPVVQRNTNPGNLWIVDDPNGFVVGGTKSGWTTAAAAVPGACVSPLESTTAPGVTFVFGGNSRFEMQRGQLELCGTWAPDRPPIVLHGAKSTRGAAPQSVTLRPSGLDSTGTPRYTTTSAALTGIRTEGDGDAGPAVTAGRNSTATLSVTGSSGLSSAIPARAHLQSAVLTVRHGERNAPASTRLTAQIGVNATGASVVDAPLQVSANSTSLAWRTETIDVTDELADQLYAYGAPAANPFVVRLRLQTDNALPGSSTTTSQIDHVKLELTYRDIALREQSGCVTTVGSGGCAQWATNSSPGKEMYLQGTVYVPRAQVDLTLNNISGQVFRSGIVARSALLNITASSTFVGPVIELPDNTSGPRPLEVFLTAWTCPGGGCAGPPSTAGGWVVRGRSKVTYTDASFTPTPGQRAVSVDTWSITR